MSRIVTRSAIETGLRCRRKRYYQYELGQYGYVLPTSNIHLEYGTAVHKGVEILLRGQPVDVAAEAAEAILRTAPLSMEENTRRKAIWGAQLSIYEFNHTTLPLLLQEYEVLAIEQERRVTLVGDIILESKVDALLRSRSVGDTLAFSLKTSKGYQQWMALRDMMALQNVTEPFTWDASGVQMCYMLKDKALEQLEVAGSPILFPWIDGPAITWQYNYEENGKARRLGKAWQRVPVWELFANPKEWFDKLVNLYETGGAPWHLQSPFKNVILPPPSRSIREGAIEELRFTEAQYWEDPEAIPSRDWTDCSTPYGVCPYLKLCLRNITEENEVRENGYVVRQHHHVTEGDTNE